MAKRNKKKVDQQVAQTRTAQGTNASRKPKDDGYSTGNVACKPEQEGSGTGDKRYNSNGRRSKYDYTKRTNDWRWYSIDENVSKSFGSLPFNVLSGTGFKLAVGNINISPDKISFFYPQSVMAIDTVNMVAGAGYVQSDPAGGGGVQSSGILTASNQLYQYLRHVNSGARNYEPADVIMYVLAVRDIYGAVSELRRVLGLTRWYTMQNVRMPERLIKALRIEYDDLIANLANYRGRLNTLIMRVNAFAIPSYFRAFYRTDFIYSNVFMDSSTTRGQYYVFRRNGYYTLNGKTDTHGTQLVYTDYAPDTDTSGSKVSVNTYLNALESMIRSLETDTDALTMGGDVLSAFRDADLLTIATVPDDYIVVPVFDENILAQIENAIPVSNYIHRPSYVFHIYAPQCSISQENGQISTINITQGASQPIIDAIRYQFGEFIFNSHVDQPDYTHVLDWTRLMTSCMTSQAGQTSGTYLIINSSGLEIPLQFVMYDANGDYNELETMLINEPGTPVDVDRTPWIVEQYDWHPFVYRLTTDAEGEPYMPDIIGDLRYYTIINRRNIMNLNSVANLAAFYADGLFNKTSK